VTVLSENHRIYSKRKRVHLVFTGSCSEISPVLSGRKMQLFVSDRWESGIPVMHRATGSGCKPLPNHPSSSFTMSKEGRKEKRVEERGPNTDRLSHKGTGKILRINPVCRKYLDICTRRIHFQSVKGCQGVCVHAHIKIYMYISIHMCIHIGVASLKIVLVQQEIYIF